MKKSSLTLMVSLLPFLLLAQSRIDAEVWEPFKGAYDAYDADAFNAVHTDDVLRITPYGIRRGEDYKESNRVNFAREGQPERRIDLRFEHRIQEEEVAYEVGYYRVRYYEEGEQTQAHYGRFHVLLRKVDGVWKIAKDWDTSNINGHEVGAADFERLDP